MKAGAGKFNHEAREIHESRKRGILMDYRIDLIDGLGMVRAGNGTNGTYATHGTNGTKTGKN